MKNNTPLICLFILLVIVGILLPEARSEGNSTAVKKLPRFEWAEILPAMAPETSEVKFGYLYVRENRSDSDNTGIIRLPVMVALSRSETPKPDPVLFTVGGPGVLTTLYGGRDLNALRFLDERDFIYLEQRGAKYAEPSLIGPEIDSVYASNIGQTINEQMKREKVIEAARKLKTRLEREGIDLTAYSTRESAADIEDLRKVLKIEKWNLYGISYSGRLMLEVMRRYPDGIRSVILDSPLPPDVGWDETSVENYWKNLKKLFDACREDSLVDARFPDLENRFLSLLDETDNKPISVQCEHPLTKQPVSLELDGADIFKLVALYMENSSYIYGFPHSMTYLCNKDPEMLSFLAQSSLGLPEYAWGMRFSVWCNEEFPFEEISELKSHSLVPASLSDLEIAVVPPEIFEFWPRREVDSFDNQPVYSEIPVLVANGLYDPDCPPQWGERVCRSLPNSFYFVFPGQSHLPLFRHPCGPDIAVAFLNNPHQCPDDRCLKNQPFRFFTGQ